MCAAWKSGICVSTCQSGAYQKGNGVGAIGVRLDKKIISTWTSPVVTHLSTTHA